MGKINLLTFDKPNGDRVEIGNGYILMVDSRFKDKDNIMLIDDSDYTKVQLNGETVDCLYVMGDVPYTPIIAMSGDRVDSITGGQPLSYKDVVYEADGNFSSPDGLCRGTFIVDEVTGDKRLWYGRKSIPEDIQVYAKNDILWNIFPIASRDTAFLKHKKLSNGWIKSTVYGIYNNSELNCRSIQFGGQNVYGNIHIKNKKSENIIVRSRVDGTIGRDYISGNTNIHEDFLTNDYSDGPYSAYFTFEIKNYLNGEYFEENIYVKDYTIEKNRKYYRGAVNCKYDGKLSNIPTLESLNPRGDAFYVYIETYGYLDVRTESPTIFSADYRIGGKEGADACIFNCSYPTFAKTMNCKMNKILFKLTQVGVEYIVPVAFINGIKTSVNIAKHKNTPTNVISFLSNIDGQGSLSNYKTFMIFKENPNFTWTDAYCQEITTNGFPNNRLQTEPTIIKLNRFEETIKVGDTISITAEVLPINAKNKTVAWSSSDTNVATVNQSGSVTAKAVGICEIKCRSYNGIEEIVYINVQHQDITKITSKGLICWLDGRDGLLNDKTVWKDRCCRNDMSIVYSGTVDKSKAIVKTNSIYFDNSDRANKRVNGYIDDVYMGNTKQYTLEIKCKINEQFWCEWTDLLTYVGTANIECAQTVSNFQMHGNVAKSNLSDYNTFTVVDDGTNSKMYVNGLLIGSAATFVDTVKENKLYLFRHITPVDSLRVNTGDIASVKVYARALDEFEIAKNHQYEQSISREEV